jgi:hypothetical protein
MRNPHHIILQPIFLKLHITKNYFTHLTYIVNRFIVKGLYDE